MGNISAVLRCGSCRFAAIYFVPFYGALVGTGRAQWLFITIGALLWFLHSIGTELVNRLSDREEDRINRPERTAICECVGYDNLQAVAVGTWVAIAFVDLVVLGLNPSPVLAALLVAGGLASLNYSYGLRLARNRYASLIVLTFPLGGTFLIGWALGHATLDTAVLTDLLRRAGPLLAVGGLSLGTLVGIKDITDVRGDARIGYHSAWVSFVKQHAAWVIVGVSSIPFIALGACLAVGVLAGRFVALFVFLPFAALLAVWGSMASTEVERLTAREVFYHYWMSFVAVAMFLYTPGIAAFLGILVTVVYWIVTTHWLHWSPGLRAAEITMIRSMGRRLWTAAKKQRA